jgi:hypothetical protein
MHTNVGRNASFVSVVEAPLNYQSEELVIGLSIFESCANSPHQYVLNTKFNAAKYNYNVRLTDDRNFLA